MRPAPRANHTPAEPAAEQPALPRPRRLDTERPEPLIDRRAGELITTSEIQATSPLAHQHIHLDGHYPFDLVLSDAFDGEERAVKRRSAW